MISETREINEMNYKITMAFCLEAISRPGKHGGGTQTKPSGLVEVGK